MQHIFFNYLLSSILLLTLTLLLLGGWRLKRLLAFGYLLLAWWGCLN